MSGSPVWGSDQGRRSPQSIWLCRPPGLNCRNFAGLGETETPVSEGANKVSHALGPRAKQQLHRSLQVLKGLLGR